MGEALTKNDFYAIIMGSLPSSFDPYISALNATSSVMGTHLSADDLMLLITEEYKRHALKSKGGKKDDNAAFYSSDARRSKDGGSNSKKDKECHKCHKKGHFKADCWKKGGGKEGQGPKQKGKGKEKEVATTAEEKKDDKPKDRKSKDGKPKDKEAWMAVVIDDIFDTNYPELEEVLDDSPYAEVYSCFIEDKLCTSTPSGLNVDISDLFDGIDDQPAINQFTSAKPNETEVRTGLEYAYLVGTEETRNAEVNLYDSGVTRHMSGYFHRFINFIKIKPVPITAADKQIFQANGRGDMYIHIPNRDQPNSQILLRNVLYAPSMGVTLVSISKIASAGSTVTTSNDLGNRQQS